MLSFEPNFFLEETRDDFYIEPMMKCAWAAQLEVLEIFRQICEKHRLRFYADWGTLLGAARHQGFIPWDDDLDISMPRADYERFLKIASVELPNGFLIHSIHTQPEWDLMYARIVNSSDISYSPERLQRFHGCPYIVGLDLFPLDALPENSQEEQMQITLLQVLCTSAREFAKNPDEILPLLPDLENLCGEKFDKNMSIPNQLMKTADKICQQYNQNETEIITEMAINCSQSCHFQSEWYRTTEYLSFENMMLPVPGNYDAVLTAMFGDWRIPVRDTSSHDYPFYKKQQKALSDELTDRIMRGEAF